MTEEKDAMLDIAFACEVRELTDIFKKYKSLHGSEKFKNELIKARTQIENEQSQEFIESQERVRKAWEMDRLRWKHLPREEK